ncbi:MAG: shikimate dehydrogenase, partial [Cyanobacteria bacterium]|nr:shikimate dehydrogenase [Cyanobacteriota bacterium]
MSSSSASLAITGRTKVFGIIGDPIEHSLSPPMQNAALHQLGVDGVYVPFRVDGQQLAAAMAGLGAIGVQGFNVTIPHKQAVMPHLVSLTDSAQAIGAVNTVWRTKQGWAGTNTDVLGFMAPLRAQTVNWARSRVVVLGYGGAARAVVAGCQQLGCQDIWVVGRSAQKLEQFAQSWQQSPLPVALKTGLWDALGSLLGGTTLLVNTTPLGMSPRVEDSPVSKGDLAHLPLGAIAYDLIYTPRPTRFLQLAAEGGLTTLDGFEMLVQQGAAALEIWTQQSPPVAIM